MAWMAQETLRLKSDNAKMRNTFFVGSCFSLIMNQMTAMTIELKTMEENVMQAMSGWPELFGRQSVSKISKKSL